MASVSGRGRGRPKSSDVTLDREIHLRVSEKDVEKIKQLQDALKLSKSEVVRLGIEGLMEKIR